VLIDTPEQAFGEYEFSAVSSKTGRSVHQLFFGRLVAENGKIKLLREAKWPGLVSRIAPACFKKDIVSGRQNSP